MPPRRAHQLVGKPTHLAALIAEGKVRPSVGPQHLPKPTKLRGAGMSATAYVVEGRR